MADTIPLGESGLTIPSDSETYDAHNTSGSSPSPSSSSSTPLVLYKPPTLLGLVRGAAINLLLPFVNGLMLGLGELVANEVAFRLGWSGTKEEPWLGFGLTTEKKETVMERDAPKDIGYAPKSGAFA
ncbi:hypothetical protein ACEQ8H_004599 [Pleosporales sp. CAS-2024a]